MTIIPLEAACNVGIFLSRVEEVVNAALSIILSSSWYHYDDSSARVALDISLLLPDC